MRKDVIIDPKLRLDYRRSLANYSVNAMNNLATAPAPVENSQSRPAAPNLSIEHPGKQPEPFPKLPPHKVQAEWDQTIRRLYDACEVVEYGAHVSALQYAHVSIRKTEALDLELVDRILFENLLLAMYLRTEHLDGRIFYSGEWLWRWRKAVPYKVDKVGHVNRLVPWQPQHQWTYRYNVIDADV